MDTTRELSQQGWALNVFSSDTCAYFEHYCPTIALSYPGYMQCQRRIRLSLTNLDQPPAILQLNLTKQTAKWIRQGVTTQQNVQQHLSKKPLFNKHVR